MARVICNLPNAAEEISGVRFVASEGGMVSEDISDAQAAYFASIPGYVLIAGQQPPVDETKADADPADTKIDPPVPSKKSSKAQ